MQVPARGSRKRGEVWVACSFQQAAAGGSGQAELLLWRRGHMSHFIVCAHSVYRLNDRRRHALSLELAGVGVYTIYAKLKAGDWRPGWVAKGHTCNKGCSSATHINQDQF